MPVKPTYLVFRHVPHEGLGTLAPVLKQADFAHRYLDTPKHKGVLPALKNFHGLIIMGGPMGVYEQDRYPFLKKELLYIKKAIASGKPVLGICLGSQLIAAALGRRVYPNEFKEIGWYTVDVTRDGARDPVFSAAAKKPVVFQWHGDTFDLPKGAKLLATSPHCKNQAFRFKDHVYAMQFHLEVDGAMVRDWLGQPGAEKELASLGPGIDARIRRAIPREEKKLKRWSRRFFSRFLANF